MALRKVTRTKPVALVASAVIGVILVAGALVLAARAVPSGGAGGPTLTGSYTGRVSQVNRTGNAVCLDVNGSSVCGDVWLPSGQAAPSLGSTLTVWVLRVPIANGASVEEWVPQPPPANGYGT